MLRKTSAQDSPTVDRKSFPTRGGRKKMVGPLDSPSGVVDLYPIVYDLDEPPNSPGSCCLSDGFRDAWDNLFAKQALVENSSSRDDTDSQRADSVATSKQRTTTASSKLPPLPDISVTPQHRIPSLTTRPTIVKRNTSHESKSSHRTGRTSEDSGSENPKLRFQESYVFTRQIFQCQRSSVYECVQRFSGERYCVKDCGSSHEVRMLRAAQGHANIVRLHETLPGGKKRTYMVMEYMDSGNLLSAVVQNERLCEDEIRGITEHIVSGLRHLHNVVHMTHNDLSPANILLQRHRRHWTVKLSDFGSAQSMSKPHTTTLSSSWFRAPERTPSPASDMWSVGALILFCWHKDTKFAIHGLHEGLSRPCKQFLTQVFSIDPEVRFTAEEALEHKWMLSSGAQQRRQLPARQPIIVRGQPRWRRRFWACLGNTDTMSATEISTIGSATG